MIESTSGCVYCLSQLFFLEVCRTSCTTSSSMGTVSLLHTCYHGVPLVYLFREYRANRTEQFLKSPEVSMVQYSTIAPSNIRRCRALELDFALQQYTVVVLCVWCMHNTMHEYPNAIPYLRYYDTKYYTVVVRSYKNFDEINTNLPLPRGPVAQHPRQPMSA